MQPPADATPAADQTPADDGSARVAADRRERTGFRAALASWRYADPGRRDVRLDLLRGFAVFAMICDHASGISWLSPITGGNRFVASAAEAFVFTAGLLVGMVYGRKAIRDGWLVAAEAVLHRAFVLYGATVGLTLLFVALFKFTDLKLWLDRAYGLGLTDPVELVVGTFTLHYTYHGTDILWLYVILFSFSPMVLLLLAVNRWWALLIASWAVWLAYQLVPSQAAITWVATNVAYFPIAAWQLIFVHAVVLGFHRDRVGSVLGRVPAAAWLAFFGVGLMFLILIQRGHDTGQLAGWPVVGRLAGDLYVTVFDKPSLAFGRLLAFTIVAGFCYSVVTQFWTPLHRALGWLLLPLGTSSLRAYGIHLLVIVLVYNIGPLAALYDRSRTGNTIIQVVTVGLTFGAVVLWRRFEHLAAWRPMLPTERLTTMQRYVATGVVIVLAVGSAGLYAATAGTVQVERDVSPDEALAEAGQLRFIPPDLAPDEAVPILLALHGEGRTGPEFAGPLVDAARANRWALIAPTLSYGDWSDSGQVAGDALQAMPLLRDLLGNFEDPEAPVQPRVLIVGEGRGARTARQFALLYPDGNRAVATIGPAPCILPAEAQQGAPPGARLPFPFGMGDAEQYVGEEFDTNAVGAMAFWLGISAELDAAAGGCPWGALAGRDPADRAEQFRAVLARLGARAEVETRDGPSARDQLLEGALSFLETQAPSPPR